MIRFVALVLIAALMVVGVAGIAGAQATVEVEAVYAAQYSFPLFIAVVYAYGDDPLVDVQLMVDRGGSSIPIEDARVRPYVLDSSTNATLFVIKKFAKNVVQPGDVLQAVVTSQAGGSGVKEVSCGPGLTQLYQTAFCK
jgi:hypothetical protein